MEKKMKNPIDFDGNWELTLADTNNILDIIIPHPWVKKSLLWESLGKDYEFYHVIKQNGTSILNRTMQEIRNLYHNRTQSYDSGHFDRHEKRWPIRGRVPTFTSHLLELGKEAKGIDRHTMREELKAHMRIYEERCDKMYKAIKNIQNPPTFHVVVGSLDALLWEVAWVQFWWAFLFIPLSLFASISLGLWYCMKKINRPVPNRQGGATHITVPRMNGVQLERKVAMHKYRL